MSRPIVHFDSPAGGVITAPVSAIYGWIADEGPGPLTPLALVNDAAGTVPLRAVDRPDVRASYPSALASSGFAGWIDARAADVGPWKLRYRDARDVRDAPLSLHAKEGVAQSFAARKSRKLEQIRAMLRCPLCGGELDGDGDELVCATGHRYVAGGDAYQLLPEEIRRTVRADPTENVSDNGYDPTLLAMIAESKGPILDAGAGLRPDYRDDVVNLDIVPYATTDVVAAGEHLPFADDTFELVISVAVLEHVRDPFAAARELERVLKPGGRIFAAVPFLQPYHGYPHHYYNMTAPGLQNLFHGIDVESISVPAAGHPIFALSWILRSWHSALPVESQAAFADLRVSDLAVEPATVFDRPFVRDLPPHAQAELAALNVLVGRKRA